MRRGIVAAMAVALLAAALVAGRPHAGALLDWLIGRYPGAARAAGGTVDLDYLGRGWLSRRAVYVTNTETLAVELWYRGRYGPVTEAEAFDGAHCTGFRTSKLLVRIVYAVAVSVCPVPAGTRIVVDESAFFSPASPGPPAP